VTREHGDIDISVLAPDQGALFEHLDGWQLLAHDPTFAPDRAVVWWDGRERLSAGTHIHARPPELAGSIPGNDIATAEDGFTREFYLDDAAGPELVVSREPLVSVPIEEGMRVSEWGIPTIAPEIVLFYKARDMRRRDKEDFRRLLRRLDDGQKAWLRETLVTVGHPWLAQLREVGAA
jgi:hypothetical protein